MICQSVTELAQRQLAGAEVFGRAIVFSGEATAQSTEDSVAELKAFRCDKHRSVSEARDQYVFVYSVKQIVPQKGIPVSSIRR